jgi:SAM-dependent methyltransferase
MPYALEDYFRLLRRVGNTRGEGWARSYFDNLFGGIDFRGKRVLDIGGGDGMYSFYAALRGASEVICLEPAADGAGGWTETVVQTMLAALPQLPVRRLNTMLQDYEDAEGFDVLISIASINHLDEPACERLHEDADAADSYRRVFGHIARLSRPGARLVIADCARHNFFGMLGLTNPLCPTIEWHKHQPPQVWARLLREAGFSGEVVGWQPLYRFGGLGRWLLSNRLAAFFTKSAFRLEMGKPV